MHDYLSQVAALSPQRRALLRHWLQARRQEGDGAARSASMLVPLRAQGSRPPLFLPHPAGGQVVAYYPLLAALSPEQPLHGVQSRALGGRLPEYGNLWDMADAYTRAIREHQPEGPYRLLGWSLGGVLAHAMAWVLEQQGQEVAFVGLVDAHLFRKGVPAEPLLGPALALGNTFVERFLAMDPREQQRQREQLAGLSPEARLLHALEWGRQQGLLSGEVPEATLQVLHQRVALTSQHERLLQGHRPRAIQAPLSVWWASQSLRGGRPPVDWHRFTSGLVQQEVLAGNHFTLLRPPACLALATQLEARLAPRHEPFRAPPLSPGASAST